jgi:hypothetical protein
MQVGMGNALSADSDPGDALANFAGNSRRFAAVLEAAAQHRHHMMITRYFGIPRTVLITWMSSTMALKYVK